MVIIDQKRTLRKYTSTSITFLVNEQIIINGRAEKYEL